VTLRLVLPSLSLIRRVGVPTLLANPVWLNTLLYGLDGLSKRKNSFNNTLWRENMKLLNRVELIVDKKRYLDLGLKKGDQGIVLGEERNGYWLVYFDGEIFQGEDGVWQTTEIDAAVLEEDVKVIME